MTSEPTLTDLSQRVSDPSWRHAHFPITRSCTFLAHAAVSTLPQAAVDAIAHWVQLGATQGQEDEPTNALYRRARQTFARLLGAGASEISLVGPTALGLSMVARGIDWHAGDEVVHYSDDYPANVYPWTALESLSGVPGIKAVSVRPPHPGMITWPVVEETLTPRTRLVALASCHFLSGYRLDLREIGQQLRRRGILFCVDGIQTLGAFAMNGDDFDFLSADSHKWLLGPVGAGVFYVRAAVHDQLRPCLLGSMNVISPNYIAQPRLDYSPGGRKFECGTLNAPGIFGMNASAELLLETGIDLIAQRLLHLRGVLLSLLRPLGWQLYLEHAGATTDAVERGASGIVSLVHPTRSAADAYNRLSAARIQISLRHDRGGRELLRISPHFYSTEGEIEQLAGILANQPG